MIRNAVLILTAVTAFVLARVYDAPLHEYLVHHCQLAHVFKSQPWQMLLRAPGNITLVLLTIAALAIFHRQHWRPAAILASAVALAGGIVAVMKGVFGRARPDTWPGTPEWVMFRGGWHGFWNQRNVSFVSGDVSQAFTWATVLAFFVPGLRWPAYAWALATTVQRVAAGAHWPSDAVGGAVVGVVTARLLCRILLPVFPPAKDAPAEIIERPTEPKMAEPLPMPDLDQPYVSLVIPCYNEQENVPTLLGRVEASMNLIGKPYEVIIVDDGSTDQTSRMLAEAKKTSPWLRVLRMQKNSGQSAGFMAGFAAARGKYIATIDADLQNDPEEVPRLVKMLDDTPDVDMINGWRKDRQDTNFRRWQSRQANKIRNWISQDNINDSACSLKVHKSEVLKGVTLFNGAHRFFPAIAKMRGYRVIEVPVKHSHRFAGTAKYGFRNRAFRAFIDLLGIRWMKMRYLRYAAVEESGDRSQQSGGMQHA